MKKLEHAEHSHDRHEAPHVSRRGFLKTAASAIAAAAIALGPASIFVPSTAQAQVVAGRDLSVVQLNQYLYELDRDSQPYRGQENIPTSRSQVYSNSASVPNELRVVVTLDVNNVNRRNYEKVIDVVFPRGRETNPNAEGAGGRTVDLADFAAFVRIVSNQEMRRVKIYIQTGEYTDTNGATKTFTNALFYPLNDNGNQLTNLGSGNHIMFAVSYDGGNVVRSNTYIFHEPNDGRIARNP